MKTKEEIDEFEDKKEDIKDSIIVSQLPRSELIVAKNLPELLEKVEEEVSMQRLNIVTLVKRLQATGGFRDLTSLEERNFKKIRKEKNNE